MMGERIVLIILLLCYYVNSHSRNNENETLKKKALSLNNEPEFNVRQLNKPFKINKLNLVWSKAKQVKPSMNIYYFIDIYLLKRFVHYLKRCSEPELRSLLSELRIQDEDERELKAYKTKNLDKDGDMESIVRKKLLGIMTFLFIHLHYLYSFVHISVINV